MSDWLPWIGGTVSILIGAFAMWHARRTLLRSEANLAKAHELRDETHRLLAVADKRQHLIDAAREMFRGETTGDFKRLREAVRALEEAEKGGGDE